MPYLRQILMKLCVVPRAKTKKQHGHSNYVDTCLISPSTAEPTFPPPTHVRDSRTHQPGILRGRIRDVITDLACIDPRSEGVLVSGDRAGVIQQVWRVELGD